MKSAFVSLLLLLASITPLRAGQHDARHDISKEEVASRVQRDYGGRVLDIRRKPDGQFRIKLLKGGRIRIISIDSGRRGRD